MNPLVYLQALRVKNGIVRSFKTPMRAAMTVILAGYLLFTLAVMLHVHGLKTNNATILLTLYPGSTVALLTLLHSLLLLLVLPPPQYLFTILSETDITTLYPLPIKRWQVFRFFLLTRSFTTYLLVVGLGALYASMTLRTLAPGLISMSGHAFDALWTVSYVLMMIVAIAGLLFWRLYIDILRDTKRIPAHAFRLAAIVGISVLVGAMLYRISLGLTAGESPAAALLATPDFFPLTILLAPFGFLAQFLAHRVEFSTPFAWTGTLFWCGLAASGYLFLKKQEPMVYDYSARLSSARADMVARMRHPAAMLKHKADRGKLVVRLPWFLRRFNPRRGGALLWRDVIITWRSYGTLVKWLHNLFLFTVVAGWFTLLHYHGTVVEQKVWGFGSLLLMLPIVPMSMLSISGIAETLRTSDLQKPLPLGALETVAMQVLQWTLIIGSVTLFPFLAGALLFHRYWSIILFMLVGGWSFTHTFISAGFLIALYNPDQHDPVQRVYATLFGLFAMLISSLPGAAMIVLCFLLHLPLAPILILVLVVNGLTATFLQHFCARKYKNFVFTD